MGKIWNQLKDLGQQTIDNRNRFVNNVFSGIGDIWNNITGRTSKELSEKNFNLQKEQFDYQKQLNDLMMEREDTAYQRAVKDAQSAGLSALSVGAGSSASVGTSAPAPQINDYAQDSFSKGMNLINTLTQFQNNIVQQTLQKQRAEADINKTNAETRDIEAKTDLFMYELAGNKDLFDREYSDKINYYDFLKSMGISKDMDSYERFSKIKGYNPIQYSRVLESNQFDKIGMLYNLLVNIGKSIKPNKDKDGKTGIKDFIPSPLFNGFADIFNNAFPNLKIYNNKLIRLNDEGTTIKDNGSSHKSGKIQDKKKQSKRSGHQQ